MISRISALLLLGSALVGVDSCGEARGRAAGAAPTIAYGNRVQVISPMLGEGWREGVVGKVGECLEVMVPREGSRASFHGLRFDQITRLRVRQAQPSPAGAAQANAVAGGWTEVPVAPLRERHGDCTPF
ncbi:hypothetical protein [Longimicrobium sp.]|jgi:hypothetical protein|uniref:hypothetical protein n=1 Tax=Longimicrobium sp. TaxID=2029185 RepID=UPI002F91DFA2